MTARVRLSVAAPTAVASAGAAGLTRFVEHDPVGVRKALTALPTRAVANLLAAGRTANAVIFLSMLAYLLCLSSRMLLDPDTYWHVAIGESLWRTARFPTVDTFSHTFAGASWIAKEWLSQLILYAAYQLGGWRGLTLLTATVIAGSYTLLFALLARRLRFSVALSVMLAALLISCGQFNARPQIFFFPLLLIWVETLIQSVERQAAPPWWLLLLLALWANLHASFPIALLLTGLFGAEATLRAPAADRFRTASRWAAFAIAAVAATGVTPYGYQPLLIPLTVLGGDEAVKYITEWQPLGFTMVGAASFAALLGTLAILLLPRENRIRALPVLLCGYAMIEHARFGSVFAIVAAVTIARPLARCFPCREPQPAAPVTLPRMPATAVSMALCCAILGILFAVRPAPAQAITPSRALDAVRLFHPAGTVFNDYDFGGYLIFRGIRTFIDGRTDQLFIGGFFKQMVDASKDAARFDAFVSQYEVGWVLVVPRSPVDVLLHQAPAQWRQIYGDDTAVVYVRRSATADSTPAAGIEMR